MENTTMGRVVVVAKIENLRDLYSVEQNTLTPDQVRRVEVPAALVDTGATFLSLPLPLIEQLGLKRYRTRRAKTAAGDVDTGMYEAVRLTLQGRDCTAEVAEVHADARVMIGQVPLVALDFVVDPVGQKAIGNPEHGGEQMIELY